MNGRPPSATAVMVLRMIEQAGARGLNTDELRAAFPDDQDRARKSAINAVNRGAVQNRRSRRLTVYYPMGADKRAVAANFAARCAQRDADQAALRVASRARFHQRLQLSAAQRAEARAAFEAQRQQRREQAERERIQREALQAQKRAEARRQKAILKAETSLNNRLARRIRGTSRGIVVVPDAAPATEDWSQAVVVKANPPKGRHDVADAPRLFRSMPIGSYLEAA